MFWLTTIKQEESEKRDKYVDLARELRNLWNMKVTNQQPDAKETKQF